MNLAIVGCRNFNNYELFSSHVDQWIREHEMPEMIISGGATGADNLAERYAHEHSIPITIFAPQHNLYGSNSYRMRNQQIVNASTHLIAFPSQASKGTWMTINMAHRNGISPTVIKIQTLFSMSVTDIMTRDSYDIKLYSMIHDCVLLYQNKMQLIVQGVDIILDDCDIELFNKHKWYIRDGRYVTTHVGDTTRSLSTMLLQNEQGYVRHLNGNHLDFRRCNLAVATMSECTSTRSSQANNKSGVIGVSYSSKKDRWIASVQRDGKHLQKSFMTKEAAIEWRQSQ